MIATAATARAAVVVRRDDHVVGHPADHSCRKAGHDPVQRTARDCDPEDRRLLADGSRKHAKALAEGHLI
jgi:hypothetical protein